MGKLILFSLYFFSSLNAFSSAIALSVFVGDQGDKKVSCEALEKDYYFCKDGNREIYVRHQKGFMYSALPAVEVVGDETRYLEFEKFEVDGELKEFASDLLIARPRVGYTYKEVQVGNKGISKKLSMAYYTKRTISESPKDVPKVLSDLYYKVDEGLEDIFSSLENSEAKLDIGGKTFTCPADNIPAENCHISLCTENSGVMTSDKVYFVRSFNDLEPAKFYQFSINDKGELNGINQVVDVHFKDLNLPFYPPIPKLMSGGTTWKKIPGKNESIVTEKMRIPKEYAKNPEQFYDLTDSYEIDNLKDSLRQCPKRFRRIFDKSLSKLQEKLSVIKMVQLIERTNEGLRSDFVNKDLLPSGICQKKDYFFEQEAEKEIEEFQPQGAITPITMTKAKLLFEEQKKRIDISWNYQDDGCYARAHLMTRAFDKEGIVSDKIWARGDFTINAKDGHEINWNYHVAPIVYVKNKNKEITKMVIDPSVSDEPLTVEKWLETFDMNTRMMKKAQITTFPMPSDAKSYARTVFSFSNMTPINPSLESGISESERDDAARETMDRFLKFK
jgi:hypothetical protein